MNLKKIIVEELIKESDGVKITWDRAVSVFPYLTLKKKGGGIALIGSNDNELVTFNGTTDYIESQLTMFLSGMIAGYHERR
jgi:hypothetical protein